MPKIDSLLFAFTGQLMLAGRQWRQISQAAVTAHGISARAAAPLLFIRRLGGGVRQVTWPITWAWKARRWCVWSTNSARPGWCVARWIRGSPGQCAVLTEEGERMAELIEVALKQLRTEVFADISESDMAATLRVFDALARAAASTSGKQES
jgi:MarR family transcriptional regulator for hemolysin